MNSGKSSQTFVTKLLPQTSGYKTNVKGKGKALLVQVWIRHEGSSRLRLPEFEDSRHIKVAKLSALRSVRLYPQ